jgi:chaperonin GroEL
VADDSESKAERISFLTDQAAKEKNSGYKEFILNRLAKLQGAIAVISVGASTEVEMEEKVERVKDAIGATQAAIEEGVVPGGGVVLVRVASQIVRSPIESLENDDQRMGFEIVRSSLKVPLRILADNAGVNGDHIMATILEKDDPEIGYNVVTGEYVNMLEAGIIDPVKVTRHAVLHGSSVAMMILTTEVLIVEDESDQPKNSE